MRGSGLRTVPCNVRTRRMNAIAERWIGRCRRGLLDRTLIWNENHLRRILREYQTHHTQSAPASPVAGLRCPAETATRTGRPCAAPCPKTPLRQRHDQRIPPGRMTWTRFSAPTAPVTFAGRARACAVPIMDLVWTRPVSRLTSPPSASGRRRPEAWTWLASTELTHEYQRPACRCPARHNVAVQRWCRGIGPLHHHYRRRCHRGTE